MKAGDIFHKTAKGQSEIESKSDSLTLKQRRVLILVNGQNDTATLKEFSLCENVVEILKVLIDKGFINDGDSTGRAIDYSGQDNTTTVVETGAGEFMCNTLMTFANRVRVGSLIDEINRSDSIDSLKELIKPWYQAISETPGGMYQADDLRNEVLQLIQNEDLEN